MFQVKFAGGNNFKKFLSNRQTKISDTLKERRFHLDLGGRAPFEWQWTYLFEYPRENLNEHRCSFSFLRIFLLLPFERRKRLSSSLRGSHERLVITRYSRRNWSELLIFFYFYDAITATSNSIDPSTKLPALALFTLSLLQTNFQRSDFVAKKM